MDKEEQLFWEMINFELGETLEYLKDKKSVWENLSSENRKLILAVVMQRSELFKDFYDYLCDNECTVTRQYKRMHVASYLKSLK